MRHSPVHPMVVAGVLLSACGPGTEDTAGPSDNVDVLVVGSGSAGLAAALTARDEDADVLVVEQAEEAGGSAPYGGLFFAAGTDFQASRGVTDSPELALSEWETFTGAEPDARVEAFVRESADLLDWVLATSGLSIVSLMIVADQGSVPRMHGIMGPDLAKIFLTKLGDDVRTGMLVESLVRDDEAVIGAWLRDQETGEVSWIRAGAVVMATGGFARDRARMEADRPGLVGLEFTPDAAPVVLGLGHPVLETVGARKQNEGHYGCLVHGVPDFREGMEGEGLTLSGLDFGLGVDTDAVRFMNESRLRSMSSLDTVLGRRDRRIFLLFGEARFADLHMAVSTYNSLGGEKDRITGDDLVEHGLAWRAESLEDLASLLGLDAATLTATVHRYDKLAHQGEDIDFQKLAEHLEPLGTKGYGALELHPVAAKAFTGFETDDEGAVIGSDGAPIQGLYAAGEVAGMLGTPAVGLGFSGSVTAINWMGRIAGGAAARYAREHPPSSPPP